MDPNTTVRDASELSEDTGSDVTQLTAATEDETLATLLEATSRLDQAQSTIAETNNKTTATTNQLVQDVARLIKLLEKKLEHVPDESAGTDITSCQKRIAAWANLHRSDDRPCSELNKCLTSLMPFEKQKARSILAFRDWLGGNMHPPDCYGDITFNSSQFRGSTLQYLFPTGIITAERLISEQNARVVLSLLVDSLWTRKWQLKIHTDHDLLPICWDDPTHQNVIQVMYNVDGNQERLITDPADGHFTHGNYQWKGPSAKQDPRGMACEIYLNPVDRLVDFNMAAAIVDFSAMDPHPGHCSLLAGHLVKWPRCLEFPNFLTSTRGQCCQVNYLFFIRSFNLVKKEPPLPADACGFKCQREDATIDHDGKIFKINERRYSVSLAYRKDQLPFGFYQLCAVAEDDVLMAPSLSSLNKFHSVGPCTGIAHLQKQLFVFVVSWEQDWTQTLDELDKYFSVTLQSVTDEAFRRKLQSWVGSNIYFQILQFLRIFADEIRLNVGRLLEFVRDTISSIEVDQEILNDVKTVLETNWRLVTDKQDWASTKLLRRIKRKKEEVESIRDAAAAMDEFT